MSNNTYNIEQTFTDQYGETFMNQIAASFYSKFGTERVTDRETQISGIDYYFWKKTEGRQIKHKVDLKLDFYENNNFALETEQQYIGKGSESWLWHDGDIWICYFKVAQRKCYVYKLSDLQEFTKTDVYKNRKEIKTIRTVNGKPGTFKNFRLDELPIHHVVSISLLVNPFDTDETLKTKRSLPDSYLY